MVGRFYKFLLVMLSLTGCQLAKPRNDFENISDYGLASEPEGTKVDDRAYFNDLQRSETAVGFESSLPLPMSVNKTVDPFDSVPIAARTIGLSQLAIHYGPCHLSLRTGPIQVDRYLLAGQWIRLSEGLKSGLPLKLEPRMDINLKVLTKLAIDVPLSQRALCRKLLQGKKIPLGRFHLNKSGIGLLAGPNSAKINFSSRSMEPKGKQVFIRWETGAPVPTVIDEFDFPATCESGIFRALMANKGFYYLLFKPVLRMDQYDQIVIKLPLPGQSKESDSKGTPGQQVKKVKDKSIEKMIDPGKGPQSLKSKKMPHGGNRL